MGRRCEGVSAINKIKSQDSGLKSSPSRATPPNSAQDKSIEKTNALEATDHVEDRVYQKQDF
jgi:hypothetical protein